MSKFKDLQDYQNKMKTKQEIEEAAKRHLGKDSQNSQTLRYYIVKELDLTYWHILLILMFLCTLGGISIGVLITLFLYLPNLT